jgi:hypothetical protein
MKPRQAWTLQSLLSCILWNGILIGVLYFLGFRVLQGLDAWVTPFVQPEIQGLSDELRGSLANLKQFVDDLKTYLLPGVVGTGVTVTLILWLFLLLQGRTLIRRAETAAAPASSAVEVGKSRKDSRAGREVLQPPMPSAPAEPSIQPAIQILAALQQEGRFIDFLQEDLGLYDDSQIGAAVRSIHEGCRKALGEVVELKPILEEGEGTSVTIPPGFDARAIRLTGSVSGDPPFTGILRHRGWKADRLELPRPMADQEKNRVIAPAEVEIEG